MLLQLNINIINSHRYLIVTDPTSLTDAASVVIGTVTLASKHFLMMIQFRLELDSTMSQSRIEF